MNDAAYFETQRGRLFAIAYRMLGSAMDAEDIVQEAFLRWRETRENEVHNPQAYLSTIVTRLCIDHLRSARVQREQYIGPWLPEPLLASTDTIDPAELADSLSMAFLILLETLSPVERAVFLLHEVFDYSYAEIGVMVDKNEANCRQIARRARQHMASRTTRFDAPREHHETLRQQFLEACQDQDLDGLLRVLAHDITMYTDGGGKINAARKPIQGAAKVARTMLQFIEKASKDLTVAPIDINGRPGLLLSKDGQVLHTWSFHVADGRIQAIFVVLNPEKLRSLSRSLGNTYT